MRWAAEQLGGAASAFVFRSRFSSAAVGPMTRKRWIHFMTPPNAGLVSLRGCFYLIIKRLRKALVHKRYRCEVLDAWERSGQPAMQPGPKQPGRDTSRAN